MPSLGTTPNENDQRSCYRALSSLVINFASRFFECRLRIRSRVHTRRTGADADPCAARSETNCRRSAALRARFIARTPNPRARIGLSCACYSPANCRTKCECGYVQGNAYAPRRYEWPRASSPPPARPRCAAPRDLCTVFEAAQGWSRYRNPVMCARLASNLK